MGVAYAEATLVACSSVGGGNDVPGRTSLYREVCELERRVRAVDHLTSLARLARGSDAMDDEREKAFVCEEPCLGRARELLEVSDDLASAETAVLAWEGVRAASRAAGSGDKEALEAAAETATRLETALRRARHPHDPGRLRTEKARGCEDESVTYLTCTKALDALHAAAHALRAAAAERGEKKTVPKKKRPEAGDENATPALFARLAFLPRLAATCGRWSRAHAAMSLELRGKNPLERAARKNASDDDDCDSEDDYDEGLFFSGDDVFLRQKSRLDAPSRWARHAVAACQVVTESVSEALCVRETEESDDVRERVSSIPSDDDEGVALLPFLADLLLRTARAANNFAAHQPRLWPKSRTLLQVCFARRDAEAVDDAVVKCVKVLEEAYKRTKEKENNTEETSALKKALPVARRAKDFSKAGVSSLTEGVAVCVRRACAELYETAPTGNWSSRKVLGNSNKSSDERQKTQKSASRKWTTNPACLPASTLGSAGAKENDPNDDANASRPSPQTELVLERVLGPLFNSLDRLGDNSLGARNSSRVSVTELLGAAALEALLSRVLAEGPGGVRCAGGGAERLEADVEALIVFVEKAFLTKKEKDISLASSSTSSWRVATKRARAAVAVAKAAGSAASSAKGQSYASARAALGAEDAETWRKVCVK